jgi:hypothetical protein
MVLISAAELTLNLNVMEFPFPNVVPNAIPKCSVPKCRYAPLLSAMIMVWMGEWGMQNPLSKLSAYRIYSIGLVIFAFSRMLQVGTNCHSLI